ncbi:MAG: 3-methylornithine--L-lysine ligase PylC [Deltaproteobacteria bacterium]|jgi:pyrrolysine biosynthesis protein PylC|nr:3-methylornithine--L-lysine ligase PylC [Deltaproteobacteria bacterium]
MRLVILGGGLQGVEAAFLAKMAGWETRVVDRKSAPAAKNLAGSFLEADLEKISEASLIELARGFDAVLPALEDALVIERLALLSASSKIPTLAIDPRAYAISASKRLSKKVFRKLGLKAAADYEPGAKGPLVVKPDGLSGSRGLLYFENSEAMEKALPGALERGDLIIESFLSGPQYSIEVTARQGQARAYQATKLEMDEKTGCRRVEAPSDLSEELEQELAGMAEAIAAELGLTGLMDLEAVLTKDGLFILEIDARFPSQTPTAVWRSTGVNLLVELVGCFVAPSIAPPEPGVLKAKARVVYEHVKSRGGIVSRHGEGVMTAKGPLSLKPGLLGAEIALASEDPDDFVATLIRAEEL